MDFRIEHVIPSPLPRVEEALLDPSTLALLPRYAQIIASVRLLERREDGPLIERAAWFRPAAVPSILVRLGARELGGWTERTRWDRRTHAGEFAIEASLPPVLRRRFACSGTYTLRPLEQGRTSRTVAGRLHIDAPVFGPVAERALIGIFAEQFAGEACLLGRQAATS